MEFHVMALEGLAAELPDGVKVCMYTCVVAGRCFSSTHAWLWCPRRDLTASQPAPQNPPIEDGRAVDNCGHN